MNKENQDFMLWELANNALSRMLWYRSRGRTEKPECFTENGWRLSAELGAFVDSNRMGCERCHKKTLYRVSVTTKSGEGVVGVWCGCGHEGFAKEKLEAHTHQKALNICRHLGVDYLGTIRELGGIVEGYPWVSTVWREDILDVEQYQIAKLLEELEPLIGQEATFAMWVHFKVLGYELEEMG